MSQQQYTCPVHSRHTQDIVGCGATFQATPSSDGLVECPQCGMWFAPPVFTVFCQNAQGTGTIWIGKVAVGSEDIATVIEAGRRACAEDWGFDPENPLDDPKSIHVLGARRADH